MNTKELHAYIQGPNFSAITKWLESVVIDFKSKEVVDLTEAIGTTITRFDGKYEFLEIEQPVDTDLLELTIHPSSPESIFAEWDNLKLGESLVDEFGGMTLVDCGGKYTHPLSDYIVRVSAEKMELVELPDSIFEPFDESSTQFIKSR